MNGPGGSSGSNSSWVGIRGSQQTSPSEYFVILYGVRGGRCPVLN